MPPNPINRLCYGFSYYPGGPWMRQALTQRQGFRARDYRAFIIWQSPSLTVPFPESSMDTVGALRSVHLFQFAFHCPLCSDVCSTESASSPLLLKPRYYQSTCHSLWIYMHNLSHLQCTCVIYPQANLDTGLVSCGPSVSVCRERATVSIVIHIVSVQGLYVLKLSFVLSSLFRVCKCSGAADRPEVHHWPSCYNPPLDWALQRLSTLWFLVPDHECHVQGWSCSNTQKKHKKDTIIVSC